MYIHFQIHFIKIKSNKNQIVCRVHIGSRLHNKTMTLSHKYGYFSLCRQHHSCCQVSSIKPCQADIFYWCISTRLLLARLYLPMSFYECSGNIFVPHASNVNSKCQVYQWIHIITYLFRLCCLNILAETFITLYAKFFLWFMRGITWRHSIYNIRWHTVWAALYGDK